MKDEMWNGRGDNGNDVAYVMFYYGIWNCHGVRVKQLYCPMVLMQE